MSPTQNLLSFISFAMTASVIVFVSFPAPGRAAELCVQNSVSSAYRSVDLAKVAENGAAKGAEKFSGAASHGCALPTNQRPGPVASEEKPAQAPAQISHQIVGARWQLRTEDGTIYSAIKRWSILAGWQISWEIPVDFPIEIEDDATGTYETAVQRVLTALRVSDYPPHPCFHENRVVRVVRRIQGNDDECK